MEYSLSDNPFDPKREAIDTILSLLRFGNRHYRSHLFEVGDDLRYWMTDNEKRQYDAHRQYFQNHLDGMEFERRVIRERSQREVVLTLHMEDNEDEPELQKVG